MDRCLIVSEYYSYSIAYVSMSRRRTRIDVDGSENPVGIPEEQFLEELEHLQTCPLLKYIQQEPCVVENEYVSSGWKKVILPGVNGTTPLTYYWHVESGRLRREIHHLNETRDAGDTPKAQMLEITESLKQDAISLAQDNVPHDVRIHAAVLAQVGEALSRECETSEEPAWSLVARVLMEQRKIIQVSCRDSSPS